MTKSKCPLDSLPAFHAIVSTSSHEHLSLTKMGSDLSRQTYPFVSNKRQNCTIVFECHRMHRRWNKYECISLWRYTCAITEIDQLFRLLLRKSSFRYHWSFKYRWSFRYHWMMTFAKEVEIFGLSLLLHMYMSIVKYTHIYCTIVVNVRSHSGAVYFLRVFR